MTTFGDTAVIINLSNQFDQNSKEKGTTFWGRQKKSRKLDDRIKRFE